ncbi:hypothetical protein N9Y26_01420 [bacterium]|nr:hypothetical protein [bacterium]
MALVGCQLIESKLDGDIKTKVFNALDNNVNYDKQYILGIPCHEEIDVYFGTFAKSMASIGAFISSTEDVVEFLRYNMRSHDGLHPYNDNSEVYFLALSTPYILDIWLLPNICLNIPSQAF